MNETRQIICALLKKALFGIDLPELLPETDWKAVYEEIDAQKIGLLFNDLIPILPLPQELFSQWDESNLHQFQQNTQLLYLQDQLEQTMLKHGIRYVILKGTAAAIYYPDPSHRILGDIDLLPCAEGFDRAYSALEAEGFAPLGPKEGRDNPFSKDGHIIELHRSFAILNSKEQEDKLDQWLFESIPLAETACVDETSFPVLPIFENGLALLAHISQHLEDGLGIRQIIDWVMYVKHALPDEQWPAFREKTDQLGLTKLAKAVARLGQKYLGLSPDIRWCQDIPDALADDLLEYAFECGNFGYKDAANNTVTMVMSHGRGFIGFFRNLQDRGKANWKLLRKATWLEPLAWAYQLVRYVRLGLKSSSLRELIKDADASKRRNKLMDELGAKRLALRK